VRPALPGSCEELFHRTGLPPFLLNLKTIPETMNGLRERRLERAIGVVYLPGTERASHYFRAALPDQFDAVIHFDQSFAVEPLERTPLWEEGEVPETYATGL
jgi:erythromycin esterase-like protein